MQLELHDNFLCANPTTFKSHQTNSDSARYIVGTPSHSCFQNCRSSLGERRIFPKCEIR